VHSTNLDDIPRKPASTIQNAAPGPPSAMAVVTPAILPSPTVADRAVVSAWKWLTSPVSFWLSYLPAMMEIE